jgi:DNA-binding NarL/FixJ family response regulator
MAREIRILLLHEQNLIRESLVRLLHDEPGFRIVGSCSSAREALSALEREPTDIALVDTDLGDGPSLDFVREARSVGFQGRVVVTTTRVSGGGVLRALERDASGIVVINNSTASELVKAIRRVAGGELWLDLEAMKAMAEAVRAGEHHVWRPLNLREGTVLKAVLEGLTNPQIALKLQIPESSVKYVIRQLFRKAGAKTRSQLVRIALERHAQGWLPAL